MEVFPITPIVLLIWALAVWRGFPQAFSVCLWFLPFGMLAAFALPSMGGLSLLAVHVAAMLTIGLMVANTATRMARGEQIEVPRESIPLFIFTVYAVFSATLLVRLFAGTFDVFSLSRDTSGVQISIFFHSVLTPLRPGNSNISQAAYIILSCAFFIAMWSVTRSQGLSWFERNLRIVALINLALGFLDAVGADQVMQFIRTATYALANEQWSAGFPRNVGGFPEPSSFGGFSAVICAYFASSFVSSGRRFDGILAAAMLLLTLASLAASGFIALAGGALVVGTQIVRRLFGAYKRDVLLTVAAMFTLFIAAASILVALSDLPDVVAQIFSEILLNKATSDSGLERGAWALYGFIAFKESYFLGAGAGSIRSNGLTSVILGSVGLPGALALATFILMVFAAPIRRTSQQAARVYLATRAGALASLFAMLVSGTVPDLGIMFMSLAAAAVASRQIARKERLTLPQTRMYLAAHLESARNA